MVSVSQPALAPQCSVSVDLFPLVATPAYVCDAGARSVSPPLLVGAGTQTAPPSFFTFRLLLCLYSFHSLCVCNICMFVLNVLVWLRQNPPMFHRKSRAVRGRGNRDTSFRIWFAAVTNVFFVIFICLVYCAYIIVHIYTMVYFCYTV